MAKNYYDILEVPRTADDTVICEAYKRLATKWFPKNNRDKPLEAAHMFNEVSEAFEVLSDCNVQTALKRTAFDQYGEFGLKHGVADGRGGFHGGYEYKKNAEKIYEDFCKRTNPFFHSHDILGTTQESTLFGAAQRGLEGPKKVPPQDLQVEVVCTLPELYNGVTKVVEFQRVKVNLDKVTTRMEKCVKEVYVKRGAGEGVQLHFESEGNENPNFPPSNLIITIKESPHTHFFRKGSDLVYTYSLSLLQALLSEPFSIVPSTQRTLDGRQLYVSFDEVISPSTRKIIPNEGMPVPSPSNTTPQSYGNLIVRFDIEFPSYIPEENKEVITRILKPLQVS